LGVRQGLIKQREVERERRRGRERERERGREGERVTENAGAR
jgi:hypothetical protein